MINFGGRLAQPVRHLLRVVLPLATLLRREVEIGEIGGDRRPSGLHADDLILVESVAAICGARLEGAVAGSRRLLFSPGTIKAGHYEIDATAHQAGLPVGSVIQTLLPILALAPAQSTLSIKGLTHAPSSPTTTYLQTVFLPTVRKFGVRCDLTTAFWGFAPGGCGEARATIERSPTLRPVDLSERGELLQIGGISVFSNTDSQIGDRQKNRVLRRLSEVGRAAHITVQRVQADVPGSMVFLLPVFERSIAGFTGLGEPGWQAEQVADLAVEALFAYLTSYSVVDKHLADQILLYAALADGETIFSTAELTPALLFNAEIVKRMLPAKIAIEGKPGHPADVRVVGVGMRR